MAAKGLTRVSFRFTVPQVWQIS